MSNIITKETTEEEHLNQYRNYPETIKGGLSENPNNESRVKPIYYEIRDGSKVLDIGCNNGEFISLLKNKKGCKVWGVDLSEVAIAEAKAKGLNVQIANAESLPFKDKMFDYVCLMEVLSHTMHPEIVLKEIRRVLKKDGVLLGSTPHRNLEASLWDDQRLHRQYFDQKDLINVLQKDFKVNFIKTLKGGQFTIGLADSHMATQDAEMLFKSGGKETRDWEEALLDRSILRVWFGPTQQEGTVYYRMTGFINKLREKNKGEFAYEDFNHPGENPGSWQNKLTRSSAFPDRCASPLAMDHLYKCLKAADLSVWQVTPYRDILAFLLMVKETIKKPIVTELDDWIFDLPGYNIASNPYKPNSECEWVSYEQLKMSDAFIVSTEFIKTKLSEWFPKTPCYVIKNALDFKVWDNLNPAPFIFGPKKDGFIRIGYTGCGNHDEDVAIVRDPIMALVEQFPNLEFILPHSFKSWSGIEHPRILFWNQWVNIHQFPHEIKGWEMDIGIAPLRDNAFNCAKSNLRWLEYSALGLPTVASPVEPFKCIDDGKTGFLADTKNEWYEKLKLLIENERLRKNMGRFAYDEVKKNYNMDKVAKSYLSVLREVKRAAQ